MNVYDLRILQWQDLEKKVKRQHWLRNKLYIVEDVEAEVCQECGERYFHATVLDAIDQYLSKEHTVKANLNVEVVSFGTGTIQP